ncbi:hypothetical protein MY3296_009817 [Beauveria thailandica]
MAAPPNFDWSAPAILAEVDAILPKTARVWDQVGEIPLENVTFENTILPIAQDENEHLRRYYVIRWFASVTSNDEIRAVSNEARKKVLAFRKGLWERKDIAEAVLKIWSDQQKGSHLDAEDMIYLNVLRQEFVNSGLALKDPKSVSRLTDLERGIREAGPEYMQALDGKQGLWMTVDELQGVPKSAVLRTRMMCLDRAVAFLEDASQVLPGPVKSRIDAFLGIKGSQPRENNSPTSQLDKIYNSSYYKRLCRQQQYVDDEAAK